MFVPYPEPVLSGQCHTFFERRSILTPHCVIVFQPVEPVEADFIIGAVAFEILLFPVLFTLGYHGSCFTP